MSNSNHFNSSLAFVISLLFFVWLLPEALTIPQHEDEKIYIWKANHYSNRLIHLDFRPQGIDPYRDPGFSPNNFWSLEQPFGTHLLFGLVIQTAQLPVPTTPFSYTDSTLQGKDTTIPLRTLNYLRILAIICASIGAGLVVQRFGIPGAISIFLLILIPIIRQDFARAWAEGPLLLGIGLIIATYRSRYFPIACGIAASIKLTAIGIWPIMLIPGANGKNNLVNSIKSILIALIVWSILTPVSFLFGGPLYIIPIIEHRVVSYIGQSSIDNYDNLFGFFFPSRYAWPFILISLLLITQIPAYLPIIKLYLKKILNRIALLNVYRIRKNSSNE